MVAEENFSAELYLPSEFKASIVQGARPGQGREGRDPPWCEKKVLKQNNCLDKTLG